MKFRLFGDVDCPDWVLASIAVLAKLSSVRFKLMCTSVIRLAVNNSDWQSEQVEKFGREPVFAECPEKLRACLSALDFILVSAAKNRCSADDLGEEMQQLGLPPEHAKQLIKCYTAHQVMLVQTLNTRLPKGPSVQTIGQPAPSSSHAG